MGPHRLVVRTPAFQAGDTGSSPVGDTTSTLPVSLQMADSVRLSESGLLYSRDDSALSRTFHNFADDSHQRSRLHLRGVAVREFKMADGHGFADYMLFVEGKAVGVLEAEPASCQLTRIERRAAKDN